MELALKSPDCGSAVSSTSEDSAKTLSLKASHGLEILYLQKGTKFFNALCRIREFQLNKQSFIISNHRSIPKNILTKDEILSLKRLLFSDLLTEEKEFFKFRNESRVLKEKLLRVNYLKDFSLNNNGFDQSHYCYMNSRVYFINRKLKEDQLKALAWANILTNAPKGISQKTLSKYLNVSNTTLNSWAQSKKFHLSIPQRVKLGSIKRTYKQLIKDKFAELKFKSDGSSKIILKKNKAQTKVDLWAILSNKYEPRSIHKKTISWSKNKCFRFSLLKFIKENGNSRLFSNRAKQSLKKKERRSEASYSKWVSKGIKTNFDLITIKKGEISFSKVWKYKTLTREPIVLKKAMNELRRSDFFRMNEIMSKRLRKNSSLALNNNWFFWQTPMFKGRLQKGVN